MAHIVHIDLNDFLVSVERKHDPSLNGRAVVIGGQPTGWGRVVAASREAAQRGVKPGMSLSVAASRCPSAIFLDGALQTFNSRGSCAGKFVRHQSGGFSCQLTSLTRCAGFLFGFLLRHVTCSACLTHRSYCSNRRMLGRNIATASAIPATITPPKATAAGAPLTSAITPPIMPPTGMSSQANP